MLLFGKKKQTSPTGEEEKAAGSEPAIAPAVAEENFVIMPEKFLPKKGSSQNQ